MEAISYLISTQVTFRCQRNCKTASIFRDFWILELFIKDFGPDFFSSAQLCSLHLVSLSFLDSVDRTLLILTVLF